MNFFIKLGNTQKTIVNIVFLMIIGFGVFECVYAVLQMLAIVPFGNAKYKITGTFYNSGPFGCFLAVIIPIAIELLYVKGIKIRLIRLFVVVFVIMAINFVLLSMSRTAYFAVLAGCLSALYPCFSNKIHRLKIIWKILLIGCAMAFIIGLYLLKKDSADGRFFMWKIATRAAMKHPFLVAVGRM